MRSHSQRGGRQPRILNVPPRLLGGVNPLCRKGPGMPWTYLGGATALQGGLPVEADLQEGSTKAPFISRSG